MTINELVKEYDLERDEFVGFVSKKHIRINWNFFGSDGELPDEIDQEALVAEYKGTLGELIKDREERAQYAIAENEERAQYAIAENGKFEYDVIEVIDKSGKTDIQELQYILNDHAKNGWRLVNTFTNELGKDALALMGLGINATIDQVILIFERPIKSN